MIHFLFVTIAFVTEVLASHCHSPVGQYVHVSAMPYPLSNHPNPAQSIYQPYQPCYQSSPQQSSLPILAPTKPKTLPTFDLNTALESLKLPINKPEHKVLQKHKPLDSNVLNNLAIALQLLIVSNLMNKPTQESEAEITANLALKSTISDPIFPSSYIYESPANYLLDSSSPYSLETKPHYYFEDTPIMPGSTYLSSPSTTVDSNLYSSHEAISSPRYSAGLMSPYEALTVTSDPILSSCYSPYSKRDFKSPYAMMLEGKDLFSMSDLF